MTEGLVLGTSINVGVGHHSSETSGKQQSGSTNCDEVTTIEKSEQLSFDDDDNQITINNHDLWFATIIL